MMNKEAKKNYVEEMKKNFTSNESVMIAQYQGLNVTELDELRKELREKGILFKITKNRITKIAIKETPVKDFAFASVVAIKNIKVGETLNEDNIWVKKPGTGEIEAKNLNIVLGKTAKVDISADQQLSYDMFN